MKLVKESLLLEDDMPSWVYMIHHMHNPEDPDDPEDIEILHHCPMFAEKKMKGKKWQQIHVEVPKGHGDVYHAIESKDPHKVPELLYDHLDNEYKVIVKEVDGTEYAVIDGPTHELVHDED